MTEEVRDDHSNGMLQPGTGETPPLKPIVPEVTSPEESISLSYTGRWQDVAKLAITNSILTFLTLGIYSFWGRVRIRKYLWAHTQVNKSPLEYHGTGGQLFVGFILITLLFLFVNFGFQFLQNLLVQAAISSGNFAAAAPILGISSLVIMTIYVAFFAYIIYSVRRYWLAMTSWRGIRLRQGGKRRVMIGLALGRAFLTVITLGFAYPWLALRTERYAYANSYVGNRQFSFDAKIGPLLRGWLPVWIGYFVLILLPIGIFAGVATSSAEETGSTGNPVADMMQLYDSVSGVLIIGYFVLATLGIVAAYAFFRARYFNVGVSGISLDGLQFHGGIRASAFLSAYVRAFLLTIALIIAPAMLLFPLAGMTALAGDGGFGGIVAGLLIVLIYIATSGFAWNVIVVHGLWKARVTATSTTGVINVQEIQQDQVERVRQGEGFGTAFDAGFGEA